VRGSARAAGRRLANFVRPHVSPHTAIKLRAPTSADASLFYRVIDETMRGLIIATWGAWDEPRVQREVAEFAQSTNGRVIEVADRAAVILVVDREPDQIWLRQIYLLPENQRQGIGTYLIKQLLAEGSRAVLPVRLRVIALTPAMSFYERLGFVVTKTTPDFAYLRNAA